jgi:hypothetical protein
MSRKISLTQGKFALVSDSDYVYLNQWKWHSGRYATRTDYSVEPRQTIYLHRLVLARMGYDYANQGDHKDRNKLNCCRSNLRPATRPQNQHNQGKYKNNTSGYKGVVWHKQGRKWMARITIDGKDVYLGLFKHKIDAARAYNKSALEYRAEFAGVNIL